VGDLAALEGYVQSAPTARVAFLAQAQLELGGDESVLDAMKLASGMTDAEARDHLARFLFRGEDVFKSVGVLSGGERSRLGLARVARRRGSLAGGGFPGDPVPRPQSGRGELGRVRQARGPRSRDRTRGWRRARSAGPRQFAGSADCGRWRQG